MGLCIQLRNLLDALRLTSAGEPETCQELRGSAGNCRYRFQNKTTKRMNNVQYGTCFVIDPASSQTVQEAATIRADTILRCWTRKEVRHMGIIAVSEYPRCGELIRQDVSRPVAGYWIALLRSTGALGWFEHLGYTTEETSRLGC